MYSPDDVQIHEDLSDRAGLATGQRLATGNGEYRMIVVLRKLMRLELEDSSSVEEYVDEIWTTSSQKLPENGFSLNNERMSLILADGAVKVISARKGHGNGRIGYQVDGRLGEVEDGRARHQGWRFKRSTSDWPEAERRTSR